MRGRIRHMWAAKTSYRDAETSYRDAETSYRDAETFQRDAETFQRDAETSYRDAETFQRDAHVWAKHRLNRCIATHKVNPAMLRPYGDVATPSAVAHPSHAGAYTTYAGAYVGAKQRCCFAPAMV